MSLLFRTWLIFALVIATVQGVLLTLSVLQHDTILSDLARQRLSVVAQTTAAAFKPIVDLGMPLSMMRNGNAVVARALKTDPQIRVVNVFNPSGIVVYSTAPAPRDPIAHEVMQAMRLADDVAWSVETADGFNSGYNVVNPAGKVVGAVLVTYPKDRYQDASRAMWARTAQTAALIWVVFVALSYVVLWLFLTAPQRALARLAAQLDESGTPAAVPRAGLLSAEIERLANNLAVAKRRFDAAWTGSAAAAVGGDGDGPQPATAGKKETRSVARKTAARLVPIAALLILGSAAILGATTLAAVNRSIEPELAARTNLIGTVVSDNVQRAVEAGVPLDGLVGAESYFGEMLQRLPEVAYIAVATGRIVLEAGNRIDPYLAPPRERKDVRSHPILHDGKEIAYVVIDIDPGFIAKRFRDVFLDMLVVVLVTVIVAFELMVLLTSGSLTASLDRLQRLAAMQAAGDFTMRVAHGARGAVDRMTAVLVGRAERLNTRLGRAAGGLVTLRVRHLTDVRLPVFLLAAANELPLSFMPIYTRAAENPWLWLDPNVVISLPLAGYLLAVLLSAPYAGALAQRWGRRRLITLAGILTLLANIGLFLATTVPEIVLSRTATGVGYILVMLACQDYALEIAPATERDRTLGAFTSVLLGGIFCGTALGAMLADRLGQSNVFLVSAALVAVSALLFLHFLVPRDSGEGAAASRVPAPLRLLAPLRNVRFALLVFGISIPASVLLQAFVSFLVALTLDQIGISTADIGRTLMTYFIAAALFSTLAGRAAERGVPGEIIALSGQLLAGCALLLAAAWQGQIAMLGAALGAGIGHGLVRSTQVSIAVTLAETELRHVGPTAVLGALRAWERGGGLIGLLAVAALIGALGYTGAIALVAIWTLAGAVAYAAVAGPAIRRIWSQAFAE